MSKPASLLEFEQAQTKAHCVVDEAQVNATVHRLAAELNRDYAGQSPLLIVVMSGAMMFAAQLMKELRFSLRLDYCHVTRYRGALTGSDIEWRVSHRLPVQGQDVIVLDDILDEGHTLKHIVDTLETAGAASVKSVVFCEKKHDRKAYAGQKADYTGLSLDDLYVFGYGLDYKEYGRQLPAIYALKAD